MKNLVILCIIFLSSTAFGQWYVEVENLRDSVTGEHISVTDFNQSWVFSRFYLGPATDSCLIYKRGKNGWQCINSNTDMPTRKITCINGRDSNFAWVGTSDGKIYRTSNGGVNWILQVNSAGPNAFINSIKFSEINSGFGVAYSDPPVTNSRIFKVYKTRDGGSSWQAYDYNFNVSSIGVTHSLSLTDSNHIWIGLYDQTFEANAPKIAFTTNGGESWSISLLPLQGNIVLQTAFMPDNLHGIVSVQSYTTNPCYIARTSNGGQTWFTQTLPVQDLSYSIVPIPGTQIWYRSNLNGGAWKTTNNGVNWIDLQQPLEFEQNLFMDAKMINGVVYARFMLNSKRILMYRDSIGTTGINENPLSVSQNIRLFDNYPNPFNPETTISFEIPSRDFIKLSVLDIAGREIEVLKNEILPGGTYNAKWDAKNFPSGIYFYRIESSSFSETKKMILIK